MTTFVLPNEGRTMPMTSFVTPVYEEESMSGLDFFPRCAGEDALESAHAIELMMSDFE